MINQMVKLFVLSSLFTTILTGCPRPPAYIDAYNNTKMALLLDSSGEKKAVEPGQLGRMSFGNDFKIKSDQGNWNYRRNVPHGGHDGPFFDGTLRIQINPDGTIYALKAEWRPPLTSFPEQPIGYPLKPE